MGACFSCISKSVSIAPLFADIAVITPQAPRVPIVQQPALLDAPLSSVTVMSSHNSYIRTFQHLGESSTEALQIVLNRGARCIELDVYRDPLTKDVFVAHGKEELPHDIITTTQLPFDNAIQFITSRAFANTSDPLFIALELNVHSDPIACDRIADILHRNMDPIMYTGTLTPNTPLRDLVGKVVILTGGGVGSPALQRTIHAQWSATFPNAPSSIDPVPIQPTTTCTRIYPAGNIQGALSLNFNPIPFLDRGATFVAMNMCTDDEHMRTYSAWFAESSIRKKPTPGPI
jgi:hypothetical protein